MWHRVCVAGPRHQGRHCGSPCHGVYEARWSARPLIFRFQPPTPPAFDGDPVAYLAARGDDPNLAAQLRNRVKKCPVCGKPNAFTLAVCNGCANDLRAVPESFTHNVFTSFIYGIARGPFPFTISIRHESPEVGFVWVHRAL